MVELLASTQMTRVRFPSSAPFNAPIASTGLEHTATNGEVRGSSPLGSTISTRCLSSSCGSGGAVRPDLRGLAQSGSAPALGAGGRRFESYIPDIESWNFINRHTIRPTVKFQDYKHYEKIYCIPNYQYGQ